jgi:hypothetical protein
MTATEPAARPAPDWAEVRRLYEERRDLSIPTICERMGVNAATLQWRARHHGWRRRAKTAPRKPPEPRHALLDRLYKAIDIKLKQLEKSMSQDGPKSPADNERETRAIGALIRNTEKVTELKKDELDRPGGQHQWRPPRLTPEEKDRVRRDLAERILRFAAAQAGPDG